MSGGVGAGKSVALVFVALQALAQYPGITIVFIGITYSASKDTILREFLAIVPPEIILDYNKASLTFQIAGGSTVMFRSYQDELRIRSITAGLILFDEIILQSSLMVAEARKRLRQSGMPNQMFAATNPGGFDSHVYKMFIGQEDADGNLLPENQKDTRFKVIYSKSHDNTSLPKEYLVDLDSLQRSDPDSYKKLVLGFWGISSKGQIYNLPLKQRNQQLSQDKKDYDKIICGVDFGYTHATGISIIGYQDEKINIIDEVYRYKLVSGDIIEICKQKQLEYGIDIFYCDGARPEIISQMRDENINAISAYKGQGSVVEGITYIKSLMADELFHVSTNCPNTLKEIDIYSWHEDRSSRTGDRQEEKPIKAADDILDSIRYAIVTHKRESRSQFEMVMIGPNGTQYR